MESHSILPLDSGYFHLAKGMWVIHTIVWIDHSFLYMSEWKSLSCVWLCDSMVYIVRGILQAKLLEWVAFPFSRGSSWPRDRTQVSWIAGRFFISWARGRPRILEWVAIPFSRGSSWPRDRTQVSCIAGGLLTVILVSTAQTDGGWGNQMWKDFEVLIPAWVVLIRKRPNWIRRKIEME